MLTASLLGWFAPRLGARTADQPESLTAALLELVADEQAARYLGRRYLLARPGVPGSSALAAEIVGADDYAGWLWANVDERRRRLAARVADDFAAGRVVELDGWVLAEAEAKLCALAALYGCDAGTVAP
jgi:hypothetical protein